MLVSAGVLAILAQFRFPDIDRVEPPVQPLERLAARATFDELAGIIERLDRRIAPSIVVLRVGSRGLPEPRSLRDLLNEPTESVPQSGFVPSLRVRPDVAIALLEPGTSVQGVLGDTQAVPLVLALDPVRRLALVRVPRAAEATAWQWPSVGAVETPRYVGVVEGTRGGTTLRPLFLGKADRFEESRWETPLVVLGHEAMAREGAFIFSLEGSLIGMAVRESGVLAVVPAAALMRTVDALVEAGTPSPHDVGLVLQPLSGPLASAVGSMRGVLVVQVEPGSPAEGVVRPGDLIESVDGVPVSVPEALLLRLARQPPGSTVSLGVRRGADRRVAMLPLGGPGSMRAPPEWPGFTAEATPSGARVQAVEMGSAAALAGLLPGDEITLFDSEERPSPRDVLRLAADIEPGRRVLVIVSRGGRPHAVALERPR